MNGAPLLLAAVGHGSAVAWYLTRATGLVAFVTLTATVVLGIVSSVGYASERWPRFASQALHRNLSLFGLALVVVHVVATVADGFVPISAVDVVVPFRSPYRPVWIGLGAVAFDVLVALLVTSALRHRVGAASWRSVHWLAYLSWPAALFHGLGSGTDTPLALSLGVDAACTTTVLAALAWRLAVSRPRPARRAAAAAGALAVTLGAVVFAALGPLRPGWSERSGTSPTVLSQIARAFAPGGASAAGSGGGTGTASGAGGSTGSPAPGPSRPPPAAPFAFAVSGSQSVSGPDATGTVEVTLSLQLADAASTPLVVTLVGALAPGGGVVLSAGSVDLAGVRGTVTALNGGVVTAALVDGTDLALSLVVDRASGSASGTVRAAVGTVPSVAPLRPSSDGERGDR